MTDTSESIGWVQELRMQRKLNTEQQHKKGKRGGLWGRQPQPTVAPTVSSALPQKETTRGGSNSRSAMSNNNVFSPFYSRFACKKKAIRDDGCGCLCCWWNWITGLICGLWRSLSGFLVFFLTMGMFVSATMFWIEDLFHFPSCGGWCFPADESIFMVFWFMVSLLIAGCLDYMCGCYYTRQLQCPFRFIFNVFSRSRSNRLNGDDDDDFSRTVSLHDSDSWEELATLKKQREAKSRSALSKANCSSQGPWTIYLLLMLAGLNLGSVVVFLLWNVVFGPIYAFVVFVVATATSCVGNLFMLQSYVINRVCQNNWLRK